MTDSIIQTVTILRNGGVLLYPTDTLWGIGCDATNEKAVENVYKIKQRSDSKSLIIIANTMSMVEQYVDHVPEIAYSLVELSNKPLTIIYPKARNIAPNAVAEDGSVAIRVIHQTFCEELLRKFKKPIISTSANISGTPAPNSFESIAETIKQGVDMIIPKSMDKEATNRPSSIIKLGTGGEIQIIRN